MKNIRIFLSENFQFLVVTLSIYLNRRIFIMLIVDKTEWRLTISMLGNFSRRHFEIFFLLFQKRGFGISCKLSPKETMCEISNLFFW